MTPAGNHTVKPHEGDGKLIQMRKNLFHSCIISTGDTKGDMKQISAFFLQSVGIVLSGQLYFGWPSLLSLVQQIIVQGKCSSRPKFQLFAWNTTFL